MSQRFLNFLKKNTWQTVKEKQRVGSASRMTLFRWQGQPPSRANVSPCNQVGSLSRDNSVTGQQSEHTGTLLSALGVAKK